MGPQPGSQPGPLVALVPRLLVTGAGGFVGRWAVQRLAEHGFDVVGSVRQPSRDDLPCPVIHMDIEDVSHVVSGLRQTRPDAILHLAGMASPHLANRRPEVAYHVNFLGTARLLEACRIEGMKPRILLAGSATVYGKVDPSDLPLQETSPVRPSDPYSLSKAAAEMLARVHSDDFPVMVARPFNHTGPGQGTDFVLPSVSQQIALIEAGRQPPRIKLGDLSAERDFLDVRDVVDAYAVLLSNGVSGETYNICSGECRSVSRWVEDLKGLARVPVELETDPQRIFTQSNPRLVGDNSRLRALGWSPRIAPQRMLEDLLDHWRTQTRAS